MIELIQKKLKMKNAIKLVDQLLEFAEMEDQENKKSKVKIKASQAVGESFMVHHLKILKEELEKSEHGPQGNNNRP
mgnify:CR=1 FL=1